MGDCPLIQELQKRVDHIANFGADVAHELKNPLTSLRSASETLIGIKNKSDQETLEKRYWHTYA